MTPASPFRTSFGVVIGIDHYRDGIPMLRSAVNDARRLGEMLSTLHGYDVTMLLDGDATRDRITKLLTEELPQRVTPDDRVLFYFAGHGKSVAGDGEEGPNGYLLPADAVRGEEESFLSMPRVHDALLALPCRHMLVLLDSCFAGAFRWSGTRGDFDEDMSVVHQERYERFVRDPAWQVIASASQDQKAIDQLSTGGFGDRGDVGAHSPFALALFDAIAGAADMVPRDGGDGLVTATEMYVFLEQAMQEATATMGAHQTPRLWPLKKHDKGEFVFFVPGKQLELPPAPPLTFDRNPWVGLASYDTGTAGLFFGRDAEIAGLREQVTARPLTVVLGASGTGKSSLVKAGVVPRLIADGWHVLPVMRPGTVPLVALAQALTPAGGTPVNATAAAIDQRVRELVAQHAGTKVLLVIDQFEELITMTDDAAHRVAVLALLAQLVEAHPETFRLVVTIRTDFEPNFDRSAFGPLWTAGRYVIPPMSRQSLREVIEKPAGARVLYFEPSDLVETLLNEVVATPGALPLLSFALSEMYIEFVKRQGGDRAITRDDYDRVGGVAGALRSRAEAEYAALSDDERATLRRVMLRLVTIEGSGLARRRITDQELEFADMAERARAAVVVRRLTAARLLVTGREADGETFVEPAHDALVRGWGELQQWIRAEQRAPFTLQQQRLLTRSTAEWERAIPAERDGLLWRDAARSAQLVPLVRAKAVWLTQRELAFAERSIRGRNITRITAAAAILLIVAGAIAATFAGLRASRRAEEVRIASLVRSAQAAATEDPLLAAQLLGTIDSATVAKMDDGIRLSMIGTTMQLNSAPQVAYTFGAGSPITHAVVSDNGDWVVSAEQDGFVYFRDLTRRTSYTMLMALASAYGDADFDAGTSMLAVGTADGEVQLQCLQRPTEAARKLWVRGSSGITRVRVNGNGTRLLMIDSSQTAYLVGVPHHPCDPSNTEASTEVQPIARIAAVTEGAFVGGGGVAAIDTSGRLGLIAPDGRRQWWHRTVGQPYTSLAVSADGRRIALAVADGALTVAAVGPALQTIAQFPPPQPRDSVLSLWLSRSGTTVVSAHSFSGVHLRDLETGEHRLAAGTDDDPHDRLAVDADASHVIGVSMFNPYVTLFDGSGRGVRLLGHKDEVLTVSVSHAGQRMVTVDRSGAIWVWEAPHVALYGEMSRRGPTGNAEPIVAAAFSPDSREIALANRDGTLFRAAVLDTATATAFASDSAALRAMYWSTDGTTLHTLTTQGRRGHWRMTSRPPTRPALAAPAAGALLESRPSRDGQHVFALTQDGAASVWDITADQPPWRAPIADSVQFCRLANDFEVVRETAPCVNAMPECVAMDGTATRVAFGCEESGGVIVREVGSTAAARRYVFGRIPIRVVALSPDGRQLAGALDSTVGLWSIATPGEPSSLPTFPGGPIRRLVYAPNGTLLAAHSSDGRIRVMNVRDTTIVLTVQPRSLQVDAVRFTADSRYLIAYGFGAREVRVWNLNGSSGTLAIKIDALAVAALELSPDLRWMLVADNDISARLVPLDANLALEPFRRVRECLPAELRERYLLETKAVAAERASRCTPPAQRKPPPQGPRRT